MDEGNGFARLHSQFLLIRTKLRTGEVVVRVHAAAAQGADGTFPRMRLESGRSHRGLPEEVATEVSVFTRNGIERIMRFAFALARSRPRKLLTVVTKSNAQRHAMVLWDEIAAQVAAGFPDVTWDKLLVDAMTVRMTMQPETIDTVVATNLHADILSDLAAALAGSIGIAPTANFNPERRFPSMFEPIHGSAFDITGKGVANPIGTFWSAVMMLDHLGEPKAAASLMQAIEQVTADPAFHTPDLGGTATTSSVTDAVIEAIRRPLVRRFDRTALDRCARSSP